MKNLQVIAGEQLMVIDYRFDKDVPSDKLIEFYKETRYNHWWTGRNVQAMLRHCYLIITAWADEQLVGIVDVSSDGVNYAYIDDLVVHPMFRRRGIGSSLVEQALERIKPLDLDFVQLMAIPGREGFFERLGFRVMDSKAMEWDG